MRKLDEKAFAEIMGAPAQSGAIRIRFVDNGRVVDMSYKKGHDVPEGLYTVKLVGIKCHNKNTYKMQVEILRDGEIGEVWAEPKIITGYARRYGSDFSDLTDCFNTDTVHSRSSAYVGCIGIIDLSHSGWITLMSKRAFGSSHSK